MHILSTIYWALVVIIGVPVVAMAVKKRKNR